MNNYKRCETSTSTYFPFDDDQVVTAFDMTVKAHYQTSLNGMIKFVNDFLDVNKTIHKDSRTHWAIKRVNLVEVLEKAGYRVFKL